MKKFNLENILYEVAEKYPKYIPVLNFFFGIVFRIGLAFKRIPCLLVGCKTKYESTYNMPEDYHPEEYCVRCDAVDDVYNVGSTPWPILWKYDSFRIRLSEWLKWKE